jgi:hypothetical protein
LALRSRPREDGRLRTEESEQRAGWRVGCEPSGDDAGPVRARRKSVLARHSPSSAARQALRAALTTKPRRATHPTRHPTTSGPLPKHLPLRSLARGRARGRSRNVPGRQSGPSTSRACPEQGRGRRPRPRCNEARPKAAVVAWRLAWSRSAPSTGSLSSAAGKREVGGRCSRAACPASAAPRAGCPCPTSKS